jgi:hypothetical protein
MPATAPTARQAAPLAAALTLKDEMAINSFRAIPAARRPQ